MPKCDHYIKLPDKFTHHFDNVTLGWAVTSF